MKVYKMYMLAVSCICLFVYNTSADIVSTLEYAPYSGVDITTPPSIVVTPMVPIIEPVKNDIVTQELPIISIDIDYGQELLLDVYNIRGNGQVVADDVIISNNGDTAVNLSINNIMLDTEIGDRISLVDYVDSESTGKDVHIYLYDTTTGEKLGLENNESNIEAYESKIYKIQGEVNHNSNQWSTFDKFNITINFDVTPVVDSVITEN